jgi:phage recombination protein Bet
MAELNVIFEIGDGRLAGQAIPRWPFDSTGQPLVADGQKLLTIDQAAAITSEAVSALQNKFRIAFERVLESELTVDDVPETKSSPAAHFTTQAVRSLYYANLSDELWIEFVTECDRLKLNPRSRQIFAQVELNPVTGQDQLVIVVGIMGLRTIAARTKEYAGSDEAVYTFVAPADGHAIDRDRPDSASGTVYRFVQGVKCAYSKNVAGAEYYPFASELSQDMPRDFLGRCAEAGALRKAFPEELGGIYTPEELRKARDRGMSREVRKQESQKNWTEPEAVVDYDEDAPCNQEGFNLLLKQMGFDSFVARKGVQGKLMNVIKARGGREFYAQASVELKKNPEKYGAKSVAVE